MENRSEMVVQDVGKEIFLVKVPEAVLQLAEQGKDGDLLGVFSSGTASGAARGQRYAFTIASKTGQLEPVPGYDFRYEKNVRNTFVLGRHNGGVSHYPLSLSICWQSAAGRVEDGMVCS